TAHPDPHIVSLPDALPILLLAADPQRAAGLMLQKLPGDEGDADGWPRAGALFDTLATGELLELPAATLLRRLFHEEGVEAMGERSEEHTSELQSRENLVCR